MVPVGIGRDNLKHLFAGSSPVPRTRKKPWSFSGFKVFYCPEVPFTLYRTLYKLRTFVMKPSICIPPICELQPESIFFSLPIQSIGWHELYNRRVRGRKVMDIYRKHTVAVGSGLWYDSLKRHRPGLFSRVLRHRIIGKRKRRAGPWKLTKQKGSLDDET